ncbi:hypothetical protein ACEPAF_1688 [Sanghuangporus sanghuang]
MLVHKPGKTLGKADILSRWADYNKGEQDNEGVTFIRDEWLVRGAVETSRDVLIEKIRKAQMELSEGERPVNLVFEDGLWKKEVMVKLSTTKTKKFQNVFVPMSVKEEVMRECHNSTLAGHPGANKTVALANRSF